MLTPEQRLENKRASRAKYYQKNRDSERAKSKKYYQENKDRHYALTMSRRIRGQHDIDIFVSEMSRTSKSGAKKRNIHFHLSKEDIKGLLIQSNGICALSGLRMDTIFNSSMKASIDRIDSSKGYTMDNVQIVATCINVAKNSLSLKDFVKLCKAVAKVNV